jgi:hypothetical protein
MLIVGFSMLFLASCAARYVKIAKSGFVTQTVAQVDQKVWYGWLHKAHNNKPIASVQRKRIGSGLNDIGKARAERPRDSLGSWRENAGLLKAALPLAERRRLPVLARDAM